MSLLERAPIEPGEGEIERDLREFAAITGARPNERERARHRFATAATAATAPTDRGRGVRQCRRRLQGSRGQGQMLHVVCPLRRRDFATGAASSRGFLVEGETLQERARFNV